MDLVVRGVRRYARTVRTGSGATAVQIVHGSPTRARDIEHLGSAHDEQAVEPLKAVARQRLPPAGVDHLQERGDHPFHLSVFGVVFSTSPEGVGLVEKHHERGLPPITSCDGTPEPT